MTLSKSVAEKAVFFSASLKTAHKGMSDVAPRWRVKKFTTNHTEGQLLEATLKNIRRMIPRSFQAAEKIPKCVQFVG